jgi:DNA-binding IclR family transcriptional regulator
MSRDYNVHSVQRAIAVLRLLNDGNPQTVSDIARLLGMPKTTCFMILQTLESEQLVERREDGKYTIGHGLIELVFGNPLMNVLERVGQPFLHELSQLTGMTAHLAVKQGFDAVYAAKSEGSGFVQFNTFVGQHQPLHVTGVGKAILMGLPDSFILNVYPRERYVPLTPNTVVSPEQLLEHVKTARAKGYAVEDEEGVLGVRCLGVPIVDSHGRTLGSISVTALKEELREEDYDRIAAIMKGVSGKIAQKLELLRLGTD